MSSVFDPGHIKGLTLANRFVRSATFERMSTPDGSVTQPLIDMLTNLAKGGVGLIIAGHAAVSPEGRVDPRQVVTYGRDCQSGLKKLADSVHAAGGKICMQISHGGVFCKPDPAVTLEGPSAPANDAFPACRALTESDLDRLLQAFAHGALRIKDAGFDAVQIHCAHNYLLGQFLSPYFNARTDEYGGSLENRARFPLEVIRAVRRTVGPRYPLLVKINCNDFLQNGLTEADALRLACMMEQEASVNAIEISGGSASPKADYSPIRPGLIKTKEQEATYRREAAAIKKKLGIPLILVGCIRTLETAQELLNEGAADFIALSRPLLSEPDLIKRWQAGDTTRARCASDNLCVQHRPLALRCFTCEGMPE